MSSKIENEVIRKLTFDYPPSENVEDACRLAIKLTIKECSQEVANRNK